MKEKFICRFFCFFAAIAMTVSFTGCSEDDGPREGDIWDIPGVGFTFEIVDSKGVNLLDTTRTDNALNDKFYMIFKGKQYDLSHTVYEEYLDRYEEYLKWVEEQNSAKSRAVFVSFDGLQLMPIMEPDDTPYQAYVPGARFLLTFGEFEGTDNYDHTMTLVWPEKNIRHELRVTNTFRWKHHKPDINRHFYLDGKEIDRSWIKNPIRIACP